MTMMNELIISFDQTGLRMVPVRTKKKDRKTAVDKREITVVIGVSTTGVVLPARLINKGLTDRSHSSAKLPNDWCITHTERHWSTSESLFQYAHEIIIPFVNKIRNEIGHSGGNKAHALALLDAYKAHHNERFLDLIHQTRI